MGPKRDKVKAKPMSLAKRIVVYSGYAFMVCVLAMYFVTGVGPYDIPPVARQFQSEMDRSLELGLPLTEAEIERPIPDAGNAAIEVVPIARELRRIVKFPEFGLPERTPDPESLEKMGVAVRQASSALDDAQSVINAGTGWFIDYDLELASNIEYREFSECKHLARLFQMRAYLRALEADVDGAIDDLDTVRRLGRWLATNTIAVGFLSGTGLELSTVRMAALIAYIRRNDPGALNALAKWVGSAQGEPDVRSLMRQEFFFALTIARNLDHYGGIRTVLSPVMSHSDEVFVFNPDGLRRSGLPSGMWERAFMTHVARVYNVGFASVKNESDLAFGWSKAMTDATEELDRAGTLSVTFAQVVVPLYFLADRLMARLDAARAMSLAAIEVHLFRLERGAYPAHLSEVGQYTDPFTGKSLGYSRSKNGFRVWSTDDDLSDDGGTTRFDPVTKGRDFVYVVPPFEYQPFAP
jgi:hypothetical protein